MKKSLLFVITIIFLIGFSFAATNSTTNSTNSTIVSNEDFDTSNGEGIDGAYSCIEDLVDSKNKADISLQEAVFATLATGSDNKLSEIIEENKGTNCWPKSNCNLKETAQVLLAYDRINKATGPIESWIMSHNASAKDLTWYLEIAIENQEESECTLSYSGNEKKVQIDENQVISGSTGTCLSISSSGYWLKIKDTCLEENFKISCDKDFVTTLIYEKNSGGTIYVSSDTHSQASLGTTEEEVNSKCFKTGSSCDYEGTLWSAYVLDQLGEDVSAYMPYLLALEDNNERYFPSAFLYILTRDEDQYSKIIENQKSNQYWQITSSPYNRFYDTALAIMALTGSSADEVSSASDYLMSIQNENGCWNNNNLRDTAFLAYALETRSVSPGNGGGGGSSLEGCTEAGKYCLSSNLVCWNSDGETLDEFYCPGTGVCCSADLEVETCAEKDGIVCDNDEECTGATAASSDGTCCIEGTCIQEEEPITATCEEVATRACKSACGDEEEERFSETCEISGQVCCEAKEKSGLSGFLIWLLILLIILVILAIVFRKKIILWLEKKKAERKKKQFKNQEQPAQQRFIPGRPMGPMPLNQQRFGPANVGPRPIIRRPFPGPGTMQRPSNSARDKELEEAMKKLKRK